ncbi:PL29 family lyase N-terminal domain-containing protein [Phocaeicola plebeius]|uniref:PL29 family lyase N-terminal domain-containing protein n=1 Tax=Phocaeicola plebeius TaxID=310297 RepID=UPI0026EA4365|nr:PL29 family lyase N-terminal domain-containing protein [Phocaeicola plebeius]
MKKIKYILLGILSITALFACSDRDEIQNDINDLNARLDKIEAMLPQMNENIALYQAALNGKYMIVDCVKEADGDYVLKLSNGEEFNVGIYSGAVADEELPLLEIRDEIWYYKYPGDTDFQPLLDENEQPVSASIDGRTPQFKVNEFGYWIYSFDDENWLGGASIGPADPGKTFSSLFSSVETLEDGSLLIFGLLDGSTVEIPVFNGLTLTLADYDGSPVTFSPGDTKDWTIEQGNKVDKIVIETVNWSIKVEETKMTVTAPAVNPIGKEYDDQLVLKIYSKEGYCRVVTIPVKLSV